MLRQLAETTDDALKMAIPEETESAGHAVSNESSENPVEVEEIRTEQVPASKVHTRKAAPQKKDEPNPLLLDPYEFDHCTITCLSAHAAPARPAMPCSGSPGSARSSTRAYGLANWLAGLRADVPSIVFDWEREIPFVGWTIFPYWTTNLFYAASLLLCRTPAELGTHARRLLTAQLVAIACFLLFPLKFSWPKPEVEGFFGFFYEALGAFDKPFNQAPSLHVALTVILAAFYFRLLPKALRLVFAAWSVLVVVSVLTTYQHHFIDIPPGFLLGLVCLWVCPFDAETPLRAWRLTDDPRRRRLALYYVLGALVFAGAGLRGGGAWLWLLWPALSLGLVSLAYLGFGPALFAKRDDGHMSWPAWLMLAPYLAGAFLNWITRRSFFGVTSPLITGLEWTQASSFSQPAHSGGRHELQIRSTICRHDPACGLRRRRRTHASAAHRQTGHPADRRSNGRQRAPGATE